MSAQNVVLLDQARERREKASNVRRLCSQIMDVQALEALKAYALELEHQATALEAEAARTAALASDIGSEVEKTMRLIADIRDTLGKS